MTKLIMTLSFYGTAYQTSGSPNASTIFTRSPHSILLLRPMLSFALVGQQYLIVRKVILCVFNSISNKALVVLHTCVVYTAFEYVFRGIRRNVERQHYA